jgi:hypothetical protein
MKSSRLVSLAASALIAFSAVTADAGTIAPPPVSHTGAASGFVWAIFGCAGSIIFTAYVAQVRPSPAAHAAGSHDMRLRLLDQPEKPPLNSAPPRNYTAVAGFRISSSSARRSINSNIS